MTLPSGWSEATIGEVADTILGKMLDVAKNKGEMVPYLRNINVRWGNFDLTDLQEMRVTSDELKALAVRDGDLFVCEGGEPGRCAIWQGGNQRIVFQKALHRLRAMPGIEPEFIARHLVFSAAKDAFSGLLTGTTIKHLTQVALKKVELPLPPAAEQRRIVAKLDALTARIARARAELDRVPALVSHLKRSALDEIFSVVNLARWPALKIGELIEDGAIGLVRSKEEQSDAGVPYVRMNHYDLDGKFNRINLTHVKCSPAELGRYELKAGDILFNTRNSFELVGKVAIWPSKLPGHVYNNNLLRIRFDDELIAQFAFNYMRSPIFRSQMDEEKKATTSVAAIYQRSLYERLMPVPPLSEQSSIAEHISKTFAHADRLEAEAARARELLDRLETAILAKAFRGELVPQDPDDEPAVRLLERIRAERAVAPKAKRGRRAAS